MQSAGNDYIYIEAEQLAQRRSVSLRALAKKISHRRYGIGSDGLVIIDSTARSMRMFNSDGSESAMCGNAIFCVAKYLFEKTPLIQKQFTIRFAKKCYLVQVFLDQLGLVVEVGLQVAKPSLQMGDFVQAAKRAQKEQFLAEQFSFGNLKLCGSLVALQNPHFVVFVEDLTTTPVRKWGSMIEKHKFFPQGINIEFVQIINRKEVVQRTWERGSGETWACGSGACAVCVAGYLTKKTDSSLLVRLRGGELLVSYSKDSLKLRGRPLEVFVGDCNF